MENHTSDGQSRPNGITRDEFLRRIMHSGEVTKIAQHLALVIFLCAEGTNQTRMSVRDLERITGWTRTAISDHLAELKIFMEITFGSGRAKTLFQLQGVIEQAISAAVVSGTLASTPAATADANLVARQADAIVAKEADANPVVASQPDAVVASQPDASKESFPPYPPSKKDTNPTTLSCSGRAHEQAEECEPVQVNGKAIYGPDFTLDFGAIDMAASLIGMPGHRARAIAEICARDWAVNKIKPQNPMAMVRAAIRSDFNQGQVQEIRIEKAKGSGSDYHDARTKADMDWGKIRRQLAGETS